jgi:hypothetical protein
MVLITGLESGLFGEKITTMYRFTGLSLLITHFKLHANQNKTLQKEAWCKIEFPPALVHKFSKDLAAIFSRFFLTY